MIRSPRRLSPEVRALLDEERDIPTLPAAVRARMLARARAALAAGAAAPAAAPARVAPGTRWAVAAALVCMASAAAVIAAYGIHAQVARVAAPVVIPPAPAPISVPARAPDAPPVVAPAEDELPPPSPPTPRLSPAEALRSELRLLRIARTAVARQHFAAALVPIAEHARRFKDGRLAEEREALRVKALVGLGRTADARRAAAAFRTRFPHSVLLPAVGQMSAAGP